MRIHSPWLGVELDPAAGPLHPVQLALRPQQVLLREPLRFGYTQRSQNTVGRNTSRPPGRRSRAASAIQRSGSDHTLAPYSLTTRSKPASGSGTFSALPSTKGEHQPEALLTAGRGGQLCRGEVDPDRPGPLPGEQAGLVRGAAAQLEHIQRVDVAKDTQIALGDLEQPPGDLVGGLGPVGVVVGELRVDDRPHRPVVSESAPASGNDTGPLRYRGSGLWAANSSSVKMPWSLSSARSLSCWTMSC